MKKSLRKTIVSLVAAIAMVVPMGAIGVSTVSATTSTTEIKNFQTSPAVSGDYASCDAPRSKGTDTCVYLRVTSSTYPVVVQTWGTQRLSWSSIGENCTIGENGAHNSSIEIDEGQVEYIRNTIYDEGYGYAGLKMTSTNYYHSAMVDGWWAPDSNVSN